jgi:xanthine/CO dehydrogenase XdhC/CoxF family maturation factor
MNHRPVSLSEFFKERCQRGEPLALATIIDTAGSTYRKAGAQMLIASDGSAAGLLSGGCLEADLGERARRTIETGNPVIVEYDTRSSDDVLWGIGLGCEGAMRILLMQIGPVGDYEPFAYQERSRAQGIETVVAIVTAGNATCPVGMSWTGDRLPPPLTARLPPSLRHPQSIDVDGTTVLVVPVELPPRLLVLGAGPDAQPLVEIAGLMGWRVNVFDHRPAYAVAERFPRAREVRLSPADALPGWLANHRYDAAVVMSHHLTSDQAYLAALAQSDIGYVGLLGPAPRRSRLMREIGARADALQPRLHGPVGLDIGARTPETIALAIVAEIQAVLAGHPGGFFRKGTG